MTASCCIRIVRRLAVTGLGTLLAATPLAAGDGSLQVTVRDNYGIVPEATVRAVSASGTETRARTGDDGVARFDALPEGRYEVRASAPGFAAASVSDVTVATGGRREVEVQLTLAQLSTELTVETPSRREQLLLEVPEPTSVYTEDEIEDTAARTAKDFLVEQAGAGVQVNAGGGQGHLSINGIPNSGVLVLVNGRRFLGKDANGNLNLEDLPIAGVERIEVVKGAGSALYGSDALGGVVNFITVPSDERGVDNTATLSAGSYEDFRVSDTFSWRGSRGGFGATGGYRTFDGFDLQPDDPQTVGQPASRWWTGSVVGDVRLSSRLIARLFADYQDRHIDPYFFAGATQQGSVYNSVRDLIRVNVSPEIEFLPSDHASVRLQYDYGKYRRDESRSFVDTHEIDEQDPWREENHELKLTGRLAWRMGEREQPLQGGYEYRKEKLERGSLDPAAMPERDINVFWVHQELGLGPVALSGGIRYDDYSDFGHEWSPTAGITVALAEHHRVKASYGQGFRPPYFGQLYLLTPPFFVGNPDLVPEKSESYSVGYSYARPTVQASADYFYNQIEDGIVFDLTGFPFTYGNLERYHSEGVNLSLALNLPWGFTPSASYTYNKRVRPAEGGEPAEDIGGYPRNAAFVKLRWQSTRLGLRANIRGQINGEVPPGIVDTSYQPSYQVWSAQVRKRFVTAGRYSFDVFAQLDNVFDEQDVYRLQTCPSGAPSECVEGRALTDELLQVWIPPRTFQVGVTIGMD